MVFWDGLRGRVLGLIAGWLLVTGVRGDEFRAQVLRATDRVPIEGAVVTVASQPAPPQFEITCRTGPFGFFTVPNLADGNYSLRIEHPAYAPANDGLTLPAPANQPKVFQLTPLVEGTFDLYAQVLGAVGGLQLAHVPVRVQRFASSGGVTALETRVGMTDTNGFLVLRGVSPGFYQFRANDAADGMAITRWMPFLSPADKPQLTQAHSVNIQLEPEDQDLTVVVRGFDPAKPPDGEANQPLANVYVELTGLHPMNTNQMLVSPRTGVTDFEGKVRFKDLAPFAWRLRTMRMGYVSTEEILFPDPADNGLLAPGSMKTVDIQLTGTKLVTTIDSIYRNRDIFDPFFFFDIGKFHDGIPVVLSGWPHSNTDGIRRTNRVAFDSQRNAPVVEFPNLLPGRYRMRVLPELLTAPSNAPSIQVLDRFDFDLNPTFRFTGAQTVELQDGVTNELELPIRPQPAIVRGRLFVADATSDEIQARVQSDDETLGEPIYRLRAQGGIEFRDMDIFSNLLPDEFVVRADADEGGEFVVELPPGVFGVRIPGLTNHLGVRSVFARAKDLGFEVLGEQGWPYIDYAQILSPPNNQEARGFPVSSGEEYRLDLYVNRHAANFLGTVDNDSDAEPTRNCVTAIIRESGSSSEPVSAQYSDLMREGMARAIPVGGGTNDAITGRLFRSPVNGEIRIAFRELPEGAYDIHVAHPRYQSTTVRFETPDWRAPGELPDQSNGFTPFQTPALATFGVNGAGTDAGPRVTFPSQPVTADIFEWRDVFENGTNVMKYVQIADDAEQRGYFRVNYATNFLFHGDLHFQPGTGFEYWVEILDGTGEGDAVFKYHHAANDFHPQIFIGGTNDSLTLSGPSTPGAPLTIRARSVGDENMPVPHTFLTLPTVVSDQLQDINYLADQTIPAFRGPISVHAVTNTNGWVWDDGKRVDVVPGNKVTGEPTIMTVFLRRQLDVRGTIVNATNNSQKIGGARVVLYNRFGGRLAEVSSDTNGVFHFTNAVPAAQPVFVGVDAPGFKPARKRFAAGFVDQPGQPLLLDVALQLEALRPPVIIASTMDLNRAGLFLPGVTRAGNASVFNAFNATNALTMRWAFQSLVRRVEYQRDRFDDGNGPTGSEMVAVHDEPDRAWFIDARQFPGDPLRSDVHPELFSIDTNGNTAELRGQLRELFRATNSPPFFRRSQSFTNLTNQFPSAIAVASTNALAIPELPPGVVRPFFALATKRGAVAALEFPYINEFTGKQLKGLRLPPWMASVADVIGFTAGLKGLPNTDAKKDALKAVLPEGLFVPLPEFKAEITTATNFLKYNYALEVTIKDGEESPSEGLAALGLGQLGIEVKGSLNVELDGPSDTLKLNALGEAKGPDDIDVTEYLPRILPEKIRKRFALLKIKPNIAANATFEIEDTIGDDSLTEKLVIQSRQGGFFGLNIAFDMKPYATKVPYVGPVLLLLDEVYGTNFVIDATADGGVGAGRTIVWTTEYPRQFENPPTNMSIDTNLVIDPNRKVQRRHFLGGTEEPAVIETNSVGLTNFLCFTLGVGFDVKAGSRAGATGRIGIVGENCPITSVPTAALELNSLGSWPVVRRVSGSMEAQFKAFLDVWIKKYEKEYKWNFMPFDYQFGTDPFFRIVPLDIGFTSIDPLAFPSAMFAPAGPVLLTNLFPAGPIAGDSADGALVFADTLPNGQGMAVKIALRQPDGSYAAPVNLGTAGGIIDLQTARVASGEWLVVWAELDAAELDNPFPPMRLRSVHSAGGGTSWSAPQTVADLSMAVSRLRLVASAGFVGLAWLHTEDGPAAILHSLATATWDGTNWSAPLSVLSAQAVADLKVSASSTSPEGLLAYRRLGGGSFSRRWTVGGVEGEITMLSASTRLFDLTEDGAGNFLAAASDGDRDLALLRLPAGGNAWSAIGTPLPLTPVDNLRITAGAGIQLAWVPRSARHQIWSIDLDANGVPRGPFVRHQQQPLGTELTLQAADFSVPEFLVRRADADGVSVARLAGLPPSATQITLQAIGATANGFEFLVAGPEGIGATAQSSSDLRQWIDLVAFDLGANAVQVVDPAALDESRRFYRVVQELP